MAAFFELKREALRLMEQNCTLAGQFGFETASATIREQITAFQKKKLMVVVAGEARRGKSSLLNALLNEVQPLFPVDINVCTNVVTIVQYGKQEKIQAYIEDTAQAHGYRVETVARDQIPDFVSEKGNPNNYKKVQMLNVSIPNDLLKEGVVFVDTPGVGSLNVAHAETTCSFLPNADLLLFVSDADSGMTESELNFLKRGYQYCPSVLFPLTKKDLNANYSTILEDNREKISAVLNIPAEDVQIIPVSSMAKLRSLKNGSKTMYANSNFAVLEDQLWTAIAKRRGEVLILPYLSAVKVELIKMLDSLKAQYQMLENGQGAAPQLIEELNKKIAALEMLQGNSVAWRNNLALFFTVLQNDISAQQRQITAEAQALVDERVSATSSKICKKANYADLLSDVNDLISQGILDIRDEITRRATEQAVQMESQSDLGICVNQKILEKLNYTPDENIQIDFAKKKTSDKLVKKGRTITMNTMGGTTIGTIIVGGAAGLLGLCIGGPVVMYEFAQVGGTIGASLGGVLGGTKGCLEALDKYDELDVSTVRKALIQHITTSVSGISRVTGNTLAQLRVAMSASFELQLKTRVKELQENITKIRESINLSRSEIPQTAAKSKKQIEQLQQLITLFDNLDEKAAAICSGGKPQGKAGAPDEKPEKKTEVTYGFL